LEQYCKNNPDASTFYAPTGFRRIPLDTCQGGKELDKQDDAWPCPGHEKEFERARRTSGVVIFFAVVIPFGMAAAIGWFVWRNWSGKFGQIRLGEQPGFSNDAPWVKYPVIVLSAIVAVVVALPLVASSLWRTTTGAYQRVRGGSSGGSWLSGRGGGNQRYTTRDSLRGRGDYAAMDDDEGDLLGEESDEEV
jgi:hypothetical protein